MKLTCLKYSKLGLAGDTIVVDGAVRAAQLIAAGICKEFIEASAQASVAVDRKTKGGKKPKYQSETK